MDRTRRPHALCSLDYTIVERSATATRGSVTDPNTTPTPQAGARKPKIDDRRRMMDRFLNIETTENFRRLSRQSPSSSAVGANTSSTLAEK